jgi:hypothetical protein
MLNVNKLVFVDVYIHRWNNFSDLSVNSKYLCHVFLLFPHFLFQDTWHNFLDRGGGGMGEALTNLLKLEPS